MKLSARLLVALLACCGIASAQQLTTITGTILRADNTPASGFLSIGWQAFTTASGQFVPAGNIRNQPIGAGGLFTIALQPNIGASPATTSYTVTYNIIGNPVSVWRWLVPVSNALVSIVSVQFPPAGLIGNTATVNPSQLLQAGAVTGNCLIWNGAQWAASSNCGGGGGGSFSSITSGTNTFQNLVVGNSSVLSPSNGGVISANQINGQAINSLLGNSTTLPQAMGPFTQGNLLSTDANNNIVNSGIVGTSVIKSTDSWVNPSWITSLAGSKITGNFTCATMPALTGDVQSAAGSCATTAVSTNGTLFALSATIDTTNAGNLLTGTVPGARLPAINLAASGPGGVTGNLPIANLAGGVNANSTTVLFGDNTWRAVTAGGTVTNSAGPLPGGGLVIGNGGNDVKILGSLGTTATVLHGNPAGAPTFGPVILATDVSGVLATANGGLGTASIAFAGPSGGAKTFTLPNASATILTTNSLVAPNQGGTGQDFSTITKGAVVGGSGPGALAFTTVGADGTVLTASSGSPTGLAWTSTSGTGTVTSITTTSPIVGGPITTTGTLSCPTCVTDAGTIPANQLVIGSGVGATVQALGTLGTSTNVLHGGSPPTFSAVSLATDVTGTLAAGAAPAFAGGDVTSPGGSLVLTAVSIHGTTVPTNAAADQVIVTTSSAVAAWKSMTDCAAAGQGVTYAVSTHSFGCGNGLATVTNDTNVTGTVGGANNSQIALGWSGSLATGRGGTGTTSLLTGIVRGGPSFTASELSGDASTSSSNVVTVLAVHGTTVPVNAAANQVLVTSASATGVWSTLANCLDTGGNHLNYNASTQGFSCGTSGGTVGSAAFNTLTSGTNTQAAMIVSTGASLAPTDSLGSHGTISANQINGVTLANLLTGILKNNTITGQPSIAVAGDFPTLNQNTTGTAASITGLLVGANFPTLTLNQPVIGGGAGALPTTGTRSGNTTTFATTFGSFTSGHSVSVDSNGNFVDGGGSPPVSTIVDPASFGAVCNGNSGNASADTAGIQGAIDSIPAISTSQSPTVVQIRSGTCYINAQIKVRRNGMVLQGYGGFQHFGTTAAGQNIPQTAGGTRLVRTGFSGTLLQVDPADICANNGQCAVDARGISVKNLTIDNGGDSNPVIRVASLSGLSGQPEFSNLFITNFSGTCMYFTFSGPSSSFSTSPYPSEHIKLDNDLCLAIGVTPSGPSLLIEGANQINVLNSSFQVQPNMTGSVSHTNTDIASIEIRTGNFRLVSYNGVLENNVSQGYPIAIRVRGLDNTLNPFGFGGCSVNTGCPTSSDHFSPQNWVIKNHHVEGYNRYLVVNDESFSFPRNQQYGISHEISFDNSNTSNGSFGSGPVYRADLHYMSGGVVDNTYYSAAFDLPGGFATIHMDSTTDNILIHVPYSTVTMTALPIIDTGGNSKVHVNGGRFGFTQLPACAATVCIIPNTDAPKGTQLWCSDCNNAAAGTAVSSGGSSGRAVVSNGSQWVGQ